LSGRGISPFAGRGGRSLYDHWKDGFRTFHGFSVHGFPNLFWTGFTQVGLSANITSMFDDQARHIAWIIGEALRRGITTVEPTAAAEDHWVNTIRENTFDVQAFLDACTPGYYNNEGGPVHRKHIGEPYAPGIHAFNALLKEWRDAGDLEGMIIDG
jgi:cyclohexanone monooxygenase